MLPALRQELALHPGPRTVEGAPTWSLHDPVRNLFFGLDWLGYEILCRWDLDDEDAILAAIERETTLTPEAGDVQAIARFLQENELVHAPTAQRTVWLHRQARQRRARPGQWLLHHYLFFRVPLWRPDRWLTRSLPLVEPLFSRTFLLLTLLALAVGLVETSRQWERFATTLVDTFTLEGMAGFLAALVFVKVLHELGHAFTAKRFGCRVPTMGVAFLVLFPVAYTDVTEVWKLADRRKRLAVGMAGIRTELMVAAWSTLIWALVPDGSFRDVMFLLATTTWVTTLVVNASPFMRFDGYFMLMDWLGEANLHQRAFALARWRLRDLLFGLGEPPPEALPAARRRGFILFAYATWTYRLVVFGGIAILVYSLAPKPVGPILGLIEVWFFILQPVLKEMAVWVKTARRAVRSPRFRGVVALVAVVLIITLVPWDRRVHAEGLLRPTGLYTLVVPEAVQVLALPVADGQTVAKGDTLFELTSPDLDHKRRQTSVQAATAARQSDTAGINAELREKLGAIRADRARLEAELVAVGAEQTRHRITAPTDGRLLLADLDLKPGDWVRKNETLATVIDGRGWQVVTYLTEADLGRIQVGNGATFHPEYSGLEVMRLHVEAIDRDATRILADGILGSTAGGRILVRETTAGPVPETALYRVVLRLDDGAAPPGHMLLRGDIVLYGRPKSLAGDFVRAAASLLIREGGF